MDVPVQVMCPCRGGVASPASQTLEESETAHVVVFEGGGVDWLVGQLPRDLRKMGALGKIMLQSDQEKTHLGCAQ